MTDGYETARRAGPNPLNRANRTNPNSHEKVAPRVTIPTAPQPAQPSCEQYGIFVTSKIEIARLTAGRSIADLAADAGMPEHDVFSSLITRDRALTVGEAILLARALQLDAPDLFAEPATVLVEVDSLIEYARTLPTEQQSELADAIEALAEEGRTDD